MSKMMENGQSMLLVRDARGGEDGETVDLSLDAAAGGSKEVRLDY
jgi:hypothetical protein